MEKSIVYKYEPTSMQSMLHSDGTRFKVVVVGRRSGKSTYAFNEAIATCVAQPNQKVWILVPTYPQARDVYWRGSDITRYLTKEMYKKKNDVELMIEFHNGSVLQLKSAERPESLRGSGLDLLIWDEVASTRYAKMIWDEILLPSLSDKMGKAVFIGTPKGYNFFFDLYQYAQHAGEDWHAWQIPTKDSGNYWTLTKDGINELKRLEETMSEDAYCQEYGADFRKHTGLVFKEFEREIHVRNFEIKTKFPLEIGQDFGYTNPTAVVFSYFDDDDNWWIFDEYYWANRTIFEHAGSIRAQRERYPNSMKAIYGDSEDSSAIAEYSRYGWFITPSIKDRKSVVTGIDRIIERLKVNPITKNPKLFIHSNCVNLIKEIERYRWKERRADSDQDEPEKEFDHLMDAMRYVILMHYKHKTNFISPARFSYIPSGANIQRKKKSMWDYKP